MNATRKTTITSQEFEHFYHRNPQGMEIHKLDHRLGTYFELIQTYEDIYGKDVSVGISVSIHGGRVAVECPCASTLDWVADGDPDEQVSHIRALGWEIGQAGLLAERVWNLIDCAEKIKAAGVDLLTDPH